LSQTVISHPLTAWHIRTWCMLTPHTRKDALETTSSELVRISRDAHVVIHTLATRLRPSACTQHALISHFTRTTPTHCMSTGSARAQQCRSAAANSHDTPTRIDARLYTSRSVPRSLTRNRSHSICTTPRPCTHSPTCQHNPPPPPLAFPLNSLTHSLTNRRSHARINRAHRPHQP
jgi:hypothetical protein